MDLYSGFLEWKFLLSKSTLNTELKGQKLGEIHLIIWNFIYISLVFNKVQLQILKIILIWVLDSLPWNHFCQFSTLV